MKTKVKMSLVLLVLVMKMMMATTICQTQWFGSALHRSSDVGVWANILGLPPGTVCCLYWCVLGVVL